MANFSVIQSDSTGFAWKIDGLSQPWSSYSFATLFTAEFTSGFWTEITVDLINHMIGHTPSGGYGIPFGQASAIPSTYPYSWLPSEYYGSNPITVYPAVYDTATKRVWSISTNGTVPENQQAAAYTFTPTSTRPPFFYWTYAKASGSVFNLTAVEWNNFMDNINLVRAYKGLFTVSYTTAYTGNTFTAAMYNQAHPAVNGMYYYMTSQGQAYVNSTSEVSSGSIITANSLNYLQLALNTVT